MNALSGAWRRSGCTEPVNKQAFLEGRLAGFADGVVKVTQRSKDQEKQLEIPYAGIKKANLVVEL